MKKPTHTLPSYDLIASQWKQHAGAAKIAWGNLSDDEILKTEGQLQKLTGIIQERYAVTKELADKQVADFMASLKS